jgi:hypothetical protein
MVVSGVLAWPGMAKTMNQLGEELTKRQDNTGEDSFELVGDLRPELGGPTSAVGWEVWGILTGSSEPQGQTPWTAPLPDLTSNFCKADKCCLWRWAALDMEKVFKGKDGRCTEKARAAIRLGFHDAGTWSKGTEDYGGADGSIILGDELPRAENTGLKVIAYQMQTWYKLYSKYGATMADLIQVGAAVATVSCPLGPRIRTFVGRKDSKRPSVGGLLPSVFADASSLLDLFANKTIRAHGLAALVGAHTTSQQHTVDPLRGGDPQDSTPGIWDVKFYSETTGTAPNRVFKFPSDVKIAAHPDVVSEWTQFSSDQGHWNEVGYSLSR